MKEEEIVLASFQEAFEETKDCPRALYGIGFHTKYILEQVEGYQILALMDQNNEGEIIYNLPVKSPKEVIGLVKEIVIITRFINLNVVYQRIKHLEAEGIVIKGPDGALLSEIFSTDKTDYSKFPYPKEEVFLEKLKEASVVSFDMFDTLVQRKVLEPEDIFALVEKKSGFEGFALERIKAQKESLASLGEGRSFSDIYDFFQKNTGCDEETRDKLQALEFETELSSIIPRKSGVNALNHCVQQGKQVFILSDMYLSQHYLEQILTNCGISGYADCIVSCDYGKTKQTGELFTVLKEKAKDENIFHIGDNLKADVLNAEEYGISSFHFMSYTQLLANSPFMNLLQNATSLADHLLLAHIFSQLFDSPFVLTAHSGRLFVEDVASLSKLCLMPLILKFFAWQYEVLKEENSPRVFYMARDGYLLHEIHQILKEYPQYSAFPKSEYVLASRRGLILPNVDSEEALLDLLSIDAIHNLDLIGDWIWQRFSFTLTFPFEYETLSTVEKKQWVVEALLKEKDEIFQIAQKEKKEYQSYLQQFQIKEEETIFVFDLATRGTIRNHFNKISKGAHKGLCFATINDTNDDKEMFSMLGATQFYGSQKFFFFSSFMIFETFLASDDGQFICFEDGTPLFLHDKENSPLFPLLRTELKEQVLSLAEEETLTTWNDCHLELVDLLCGCLHQDYCIFSQALKRLFTHEDGLSAKVVNLFDFVDMEFL